MNYETLWHRLTTIYDANEAKAIVRLVLDARFGLSWTDVICGKVENLSDDEKQELEGITQRLETGEPVQYVLGQAEFGGRTFHVEPGVLIPRPETYELCQWVWEEGRKRKVEGDYNILDIGTGSGCIACTLASEIPNAKVTAWDISDDALRIAAENAKRTHVQVSFEKMDILNIPHSSFDFVELNLLSSHYSLIVSNPPYICNKERNAMERNVLEHEPELALFVPDDDPLLFYRAIARYAAKTLKPHGTLYFEINPLYVNEMQQMLSDEGFTHTEIKNDQFGKQRFTKSCL